jgi:hypothetical protein
VILLDATPLAGGIAILAGIAFLLVFLVIAFIAFKLLKRTVKMAFRIAIVGIIIAIAVAGSAFFLLLGTSKPARPSTHSQPK